MPATQSYGDDGPFPLPGDSADSSLLTANALHYASLAPHVIPPTHLPVISSQSWSSLCVNASTSISQNLACNEFLNSFINDNLFGTEDHNPSGFPNNALHLQSFNSLLPNASIPDQTVQVAPPLDINSLYPPSTAPSSFTNPFHLDSPSMPWQPVTSAGPWSTHSPMEAISSAHPAEASGSPSQEQGHHSSSEELMNWMNDYTLQAIMEVVMAAVGVVVMEEVVMEEVELEEEVGVGEVWVVVAEEVAEEEEVVVEEVVVAVVAAVLGYPPEIVVVYLMEVKPCRIDWGQDHAPNDAAIDQLLNPVEQPGPLVRSQDEEAEENASGNPSDAPPGNSHPRQCRSPPTYSAASSILQAEEPPPSMPL
ncbi:hypothetical protein CPB84DRAFT_1742865 [Gymnopilus junonius]|uniref:Uncharacterized protein n=1 Tax=Gymnopilus junonius TaxID=109634 RepID=A0A9P5P0B2_GYMJU|nr:hypothetical protein CPB84DRAFT_1742865 [Gymnopilus junonius]